MLFCYFYSIFPAHLRKAIKMKMDKLHKKCGVLRNWEGKLFQLLKRDKEITALEKNKKRLNCSSLHQNVYIISFTMQKELCNWFLWCLIYSSESENSRQISSIVEFDSASLEYRMGLQLLASILSATLYDNEMSQSEISFSMQMDTFFVHESFVLCRFQLDNPKLQWLVSFFSLI